jgi:hypothetical protein
VLPRLKVIADENGIEPDFFRDAGKIKERCGGELLGRGFVSEFDQCSTGACSFAR